MEEPKSNMIAEEFNIGNVTFMQNKFTIKIGDKYYRMEFNSKHEPIFKEIDFEEFESKVTTICDYIKDHLDSTQLLKYCVYRMNLQEIEALHKRIMNKRMRKPGVHTSPGCIAMVVGKHHIPIAD